MIFNDSKRWGQLSFLDILEINNISFGERDWSNDEIAEKVTVNWSKGQKQRHLGRLKYLIEITEPFTKTEL